MLATSLVFICGQTALASSSHRESEISYTHAENVRQHLARKPLSRRTRADYERALDAYRAVYHTDPASPYAARSIAAVANLLAEEGHSFRDAKLSRDAVAQWEFLRREYPGSALRQIALFQEAQIVQNDLQDHAAARKLYRKFLTSYPHDPLAEQVRADVRRDLRDKSVSAEASGRFRADRNSVAAVRQPSSRTTKSPNLQKHFVHTSDAVPLLQTFIATGPSVPTKAHAVRSKLPQSQPARPQLLPVGNPATIQAVRYWTEGTATRLAVDMNEPVPYHAYSTPDGKQITLIFFGAHASEHLIGNSISARSDENLSSFRASALTGDQAELVLELKHAAIFSSFTLSNPDRLILDIRAARQGNSVPTIARNLPPVTPTGARALNVTEPGIAKRATRIPTSNIRQPDSGILGDPAEPATFAAPTSDGQRSMARVLGLRVRRIVIDAGHGGHDSGTLGPDGLEEKDVALDVALRLGHLLQRQLGADVIYTRRTDTFVPLEERTAIANRAHADLFLSIHANSSADPGVRGVETYFLNFTASPDALQVAARENAISNRSVHELSDLVRKIALSDKIDESREFAADVQQSLYSGLTPGNDGLKNRGVKQAPFVVLIGANMPSILVEISFLTNPEDTSELGQPAYRERLADALYRGVAEYVEGMSGVRVAKTAPPDALPATAE